MKEDHFRNQPRCTVEFWQIKGNGYGKYNKEENIWYHKRVTCVNGSKQRWYLCEGESIAFPTVSLKEMFATLISDAYEERNVVTFYVHGEYLHANMSSGKTILWKLRGRFFDVMCDINP